MTTGAGDGCSALYVEGVRVHFVNENLGGHATMHRHLRTALEANAAVDPTYFDAPSPGLAHRVLRAPVPGLARLDLDLAPLRDQLVRAAVVARHLRGMAADVDVLHVYTQNAALLSTSTLRRVPSVVSLDATNRENAYRLPTREASRFTPTMMRPTLALEQRVYRSVRSIVTHSRWAADSVLTYGVDPKAIEVIPFGIPLGPVPAPRRDGGTPRILFIGATMARKGGWRLLEMWRRHLADRSRLVLVTREAVPLAPGLEVRGDIRPGDGRLDELLGTVDIFAMPGEIDAFGYALLEAMAAGLPVVAPRQAAVPEIVDDGQSGLLVPIGDDVAFCEALSRLISDASAREEMGRAGRARVRDRFEAAITTAALVDVLRAVASG
jgi:glycosyltransferase involved in cell wall biosynthesis